MRADKKNELSVKRKNQLENISYLRASLANGEKNNKTNDFFKEKSRTSISFKQAHLRYAITLLR